MIDYSGSARLKRFSPTIGNSVVIHIRESARVDDPTATSLDNFRSKTENFGYRYELTLTDGRLFLLNTFKLFHAFRDANVQDGDLVQIDHPAASVYVVTVLERGTGIGLVVPDLEKEQYEAEQKAKKGQPAPAVQRVAPAPAVQRVAPVVQQPTVTPAKQAPVAQPDDDVDLPF